MPPKYRPYVPQDLAASFLEGRLTWESAINSRDFKYINGYMASRVGPGIITLRGVVQKVVDAIKASNGDPVEIIKEEVASIAENGRAHTCSAGYLVRPINRMGFNAIINLLKYARASPPPGIDTSIIPESIAEDLICRWNEGLEPTQNWTNGQPFCHKINSRGSVGQERSVQAVRKCPCIQTKGQCTHAAGCEWSSKDGGGCLPKDAYDEPYRSAPDRLPFAGDYSPEGIPAYARAQGKYIRFENKPGAVFIPYFEEVEQEAEQEADQEADQGVEQEAEQEVESEDQPDNSDLWMDEELPMDEELSMNDEIPMNDEPEDDFLIAEPDESEDEPENEPEDDFLIQETTPSPPPPPQPSQSSRRKKRKSARVGIRELRGIGIYHPNPYEVDDDFLLS